MFGPFSVPTYYWGFSRTGLQIGHKSSSHEAGIVAKSESAFLASIRPKPYTDVLAG